MDPHFCQKISPMQTVQLARILVSANLYFAKIRKTCGNFRSSHIRFYQASSAADQDPWDEENPLVLQPWLSGGFGRQAAIRRLGRSTGIATGSSDHFLEIGLTLYQLGSGQAIKYGSSKPALHDARVKALSNLHLIDRRVGSTFADVVQGFLNQQIQTAYISDERRGNSERAYLKNMVSALLACEKSLENTVAVADFPEITSSQQPQPEPVVQTEAIIQKNKSTSRVKIRYISERRARSTISLPKVDTSSTVEEMKPEEPPKARRPTVRTTKSKAAKPQKSKPGREDVNVYRRPPNVKKAWQRCYECSKAVEKVKNRDKLTCSYGAEICSDCGKKWMTCHCWVKLDRLVTVAKSDMHDLSQFWPQSRKVASLPPSS